MKPFIPLFVGLAGWFLVAVVVLSTMFAAPTSQKGPPIGSAPPVDDGVIEVIPPH